MYFSSDGLVGICCVFFPECLGFPFDDALVGEAMSNDLYKP